MSDDRLPLCLSLSASKTRTDAIRFALDRSTPEGCEPLVSKVVERTKEVLQDGGKGRDDYSVLVSVIYLHALGFSDGVNGCRQKPYLYHATWMVG